MANTKISDLGPNVLLDGPHRIVSAFADGVCKAGAVVNIIAATQVIAPVDTNSGADSQLRYTGILLPRFDTPKETVITGGVAVSVLMPLPGCVFRCRFTNPGATYYKDHPVKLSATAGDLCIETDIADLGDCVGKLDLGVVTADTVAQIRWGV